MNTPDWVECVGITDGLIEDHFADVSKMVPTFMSLPNAAINAPIHRIM